MHPQSVLRFVVEHFVWAAVAFLAALALVVVSGLLFDDILLGSVPAPSPLIVGVAMILAWATWTIILKKSGRSLEDPLVPPNVPIRRDS